MYKKALKEFLREFHESRLLPGFHFTGETRWSLLPSRLGRMYPLPGTDAGIVVSRTENPWTGETRWRYSVKTFNPAPGSDHSDLGTWKEVLSYTPGVDPAL